LNESENNWGYQVRYLDEPDTQNFLRSILRQDSCVPFFGAGFTRGERARGKAVPGGEEWLSLMREQINSSDAVEKPSAEELGSSSFQEISDIYFRENIVPLERIKSSVDICFTKVNIQDEAKLRFLSINWPYIYTLNIDDGIERAIDGVKVLPYKAFSRHSERRYVYKLHGDAEDVLTAASRDDLRVIFGKADYIKSLNRNQYFISSLINDFSDKNILFVGCSLSDELDISFALASLEPGERSNGTARIFITSREPNKFSEKKKLKAYGITDVIVCDYFAFYNFAASVTEAPEQARLAIDAFAFKDDSSEYSNEFFASYLLQNGWKQGVNPYSVSISRSAEGYLRGRLKDPLVAVWGKRFSGKTTILYRLLSEERRRKRYLVPSQASLSDKVFNEILKVQDSLIAIDSGAIHYDQMRMLSKNADNLIENNTTVLLALPRAELNALGSSFAEDSIHIESRLYSAEVPLINKLLDPLGFQRWSPKDTILDNVFLLGASSIAKSILNKQSRLDERIDLICNEGRVGGKVSAPSKLEFSLLFYLASRQRIYSFVQRTLIKKYGLGYLAATYSADFARKWSPFVEFEPTDAVTRKAENSPSVLICNSYAWTQLAVRRLSDRLGLAETASFIVDLYIAVREVDSEAFHLILFDNLNSVYSTKRLNEKDWGASVITAVYEKLAQYCAQDPDYWLQRAKGIYYLSNNEEDIRVAIEYCEKGIVEREEKTKINAKLTRANLFGKLCHVTKYRDDDVVGRAVDAYTDAIGKRSENPAYIDELLRKSVRGIGYMHKVCKAAYTRPALLSKRHDIRLIAEYSGFSSN